MARLRLESVFEEKLAKYSNKAINSLPHNTRYVIDSRHILIYLIECLKKPFYTYKRQCKTFFVDIVLSYTSVNIFQNRDYSYRLVLTTEHIQLNGISLFNLVFQNKILKRENQ